MKMARVLLIEDDELVRYSLVELLEEAGHTVMQRENGFQLLSFIEDNPVDVVITDIVMPEVDGMEVLTMLRKSHPSLPVIALSGGGRISGSDYLEMADAIGAKRTIHKPVQPDVLLQAVEELAA
jgi:CheY-like chemotaxis protein